MPFFECKKCRRVWEYPLSACPHDFSELEKKESKSARVTGVVKVNIPTLSHPNVPYYVLSLEDEYGNAWCHKSEKEYRPGDAYAALPGSGKGAVAIWRVKYDIGDAVARVFDLVGDIGVKAGSKALVMPTLDAPSHAYFRDNTSPQFLEAVIRHLLGCGVRIEDITVASQSFGEMPVGAAAQKSGLLAVCGKFKIMPADLAAGEFERTGTFEFSKAALGADVIINLAMEKIGRASATGNMFKVLKKESYLGAKYLSSDGDIARSLEAVLGKMVVVGEAEFVQRSNKITTFMGLILASRSARNLDRVFNAVAQSSQLPDELKDLRLEDIPVAGRTVKEVQYRADIF